MLANCISALVTQSPWHCPLLWGCSWPSHPKAQRIFTSLSSGTQAHLLLDPAAEVGDFSGDELMSKAKATWQESAQSVTVSQLQTNVSTALWELGEAHDVEFVTPDKLFSLDIALPGRAHPLHASDTSA